MKLGSCPSCGSHSVRAASTRLLHLARLAHGTHRRYCCSCRNRWKASDKAFLPWARRLGVFLICAVVGLALACVVNEVWLAPRPCPLQTAAWEEDRARDQDALIARGMEAFLGGDMSVAYGQGLGARMTLSGIHFTEQDYSRMRGRADQAMGQSPSYRWSVQGALRQNGPPQNMPEILRRAAAVIKPMGKTPGQFASEVESSDKQALWTKYGNNFSSKEEAKSAYDEFKRRRSEIPNDWPGPGK